MDVLITGATGFLGQRVVNILKKENQIFALTKSEKSADKIRSMGIKPILADLSESEKLKSEVSALKPEAVIHLAAEIATQKNKDKLWKTNHEGTKNLFEASSIARVKKFLFASTVVVGEANGEILTEDKPLLVQTEYGKTKQASEKMLLEAYSKNNFPVIIIRPSHIYGPGGWFGDILKDIPKGLFRIPGDGKNFWDVVFVDDVASAIIKALSNGKTGEIYHIVDDTPVIMNDFFSEVAIHFGKSKIGHAPVFLANLLKGKEPVLAAIRSAKSSNSKIKSIGWNPIYPNYKLGLEKTFQEMKGK